MRTVEVTTSLGRARVHACTARSARATLVLGHGAGRGTDTADLLGLADRLPAHGVSVLLVDQPWVVAGGRVAPAPARLDVGWAEVLRTLLGPAGPARPRSLPRPRGPLLVGGRSAGARVACRTAAACGAAGVLALAFPLHPPGRPDRSRADELVAPVLAGLPVVCAQGERDTFGTPQEVRAAARGIEVVAVPGAGHDLRGPRSAGESLVTDVLVAAALSLLRRVLDGAGA